MSNKQLSLGHRIRAARTAVGITQETAADALDLSQPTYSRIEAGERLLTGPELITLADLFEIRVGALLAYPEIQARARFAARTSGESADMGRMKERLCAYLELDAYLTAQGF